MDIKETGVIAADRGAPAPATPLPEEHAWLIAAIAEQATLSVLAAAPAFGQFLQAYFELSSTDTLRQRSLHELATIAAVHWHFAQTRASGELRLRILRPGEIPDSAFAAVETCVEDQPFLVDTITTAIRDAGAAIDWSVHPLIEVKRNAQGLIERIDAAGDAPAAGTRESLIHVEFEPLDSEASYLALEARLRLVLGDLWQVVHDYPTTLARLRALIGELGTPPQAADAEEFAEAQEFLNYLSDGHFTFLACVETSVEAANGGPARFRTIAESGLGLLRAGSRWANENLIAPQAELDKYTESPRLVVITKSNLRASVHRPDLMDVISIKRFGADGLVKGTSRFVGLFAADVYRDRPRNIPLIRRKAAHLLERSRLPEGSHSGKNLRDILHELPRDELFQSSEDELYRLCMGIRALRDRYQLRLFFRRDRYGRFFSCLVYLPRDRYSHEIRDKLAATLKETFSSFAVDNEVAVLRSGMTRIHYIVRTPPGTTTAFSEEDIELRLIAATRDWKAQLRERVLTADVAPSAFGLRVVEAFPLSYQETVSPAEAVLDLVELSRLSAVEPLLPRLIVAPAGAQTPARAVGLKLYALHQPLSLSDILPTLENFGFKVISQEPVEIALTDGPRLWLQHFEIKHSGSALTPQMQRRIFESALLQVWSGDIENDGLNKLVLGAGLDARQVTLLRAICKYLLQTSLPFGQSYLQALLGEHADIARMLVDLFEARFSLEYSPAARSAKDADISQALDQALDQVASLDGDRALRAFLAVIRASLRTNYFQPLGNTGFKPYVSLKLDPSKIPELPLPLPLYEVWVYAPQVEGVHLRGGKVARGGLRWSDRRADFRTEVLGLMKAQRVKNTVIVPDGAKGGFVVKGGPAATDREAWLANGIECYKTFLRGVLDITDNRVGEAIVPPPSVVRIDGDDPYLVVAADKGTATFSDTANGVAAEYGFWLGDAFASGGSAGYDHKKMGITAKGAWESVKRHFREIPASSDASGIGRDIQTEVFTAVGIGDMSGDVFGNGMLLSPTMKLVAAFDHRHIFIDPAPDISLSFRERERLFALPRSSWADYDAALISPGGGVYPRTAKLVKLSDQACAALGIAAAALTPAELVRAILKAPVDLLWNGGIGTYIKATTQADSDAGDRSNDAVRVNGREVRAKVIGEGGNLGLTQLGRVEYALHGADGGGGKINTDAIDNAGGVHTSDREVNIKIPLNQLMAEGRLTRGQRDPLLGELTEQIAAFVLRDNYVQSQAISLMEASAAQRLDDHSELIRILERDGLLNRAIEFLPDDEALKERRLRSIGLTRPELAAITAYSKISLSIALLDSDVPDDPFFIRELLANFPTQLIERFPAEYENHRLRREIVATILSNAVVNRMGAGFAQLWAEDHSLLRAEVVKAYATAHEIFDGNRYWRAIEALDNRISAAAQYRLMSQAVGLLKHATGWLTRSKYAGLPVRIAVEHLAPAIVDLQALLPDILPPGYREEWNRAHAGLLEQGVSEALAVRLANTRALGAAPDIAELAEDSGLSLAEAASAYYLVGERFRVRWLYAAINEIPTNGKWQALARVNLRDDAYLIHRQLADRILQTPGTSAAERLQTWSTANRRRADISLERLSELQAGNTRDFSTLAVAVRELRGLRQLR